MHQFQKMQIKKLSYIAETLNLLTKPNTRRLSTNMHSPENVKWRFFLSLILKRFIINKYLITVWTKMPFIELLAGFWPYIMFGSKWLLVWIQSLCLARVFESGPKTVNETYFSVGWKRLNVRWIRKQTSL